MKLHVLIPEMIDQRDMSYSEVVQMLDLEELWYAQAMSLLGGGGSRQLVESDVLKLKLIDGDVWTEDEITSFATSRFLGEHVLELSEEVGNAIIARVKGNTINLAAEEPDDS